MRVSMAGFRSAFATVKSRPCCVSLLCAFIVFPVTGAEPQLDWGEVNARSDKWVRVEFKAHLRQPCVFTSPPHIKGENNYATVLIGDVSSSGFSLRILRPHCIPPAQWEGEEPVRVAWFAVVSTLDGKYKTTSTNDAQWMASVFTFNMSHGRVPTKTLSIPDDGWKSHSEPRVLLAVQNQKEMLDSGGFKEEELRKQLTRVPGVSSTDVVSFQLPARMSEGHNFELKVAYLRYFEDSASAVIDDTLLKSKLYFLRPGERSVVAVSSRTFPKSSLFGVHVSLEKSSPAAVVLRDVTKDTAEVIRKVEVFENCVEIPRGRTSVFEAVLLLQPAEAGVKMAMWSPAPIIRQNGGPNCHAVEADTIPNHVVADCANLCLRLWNAKSEDYWACEDVQQCFSNDFEDVTVARYFGVSNDAIQRRFQTTCKFGLRPPLARSQYSHSITLKKNSDERLAWSSYTDCNGAYNHIILREATYGKPISADKPQEDCDQVDVTEEVRSICNQTSPCIFSDAEFGTLTAAAENKCLIPQDDVELRMYYDCRWRSQGPDCYFVTKGDANLCTQACVLIWSRFAAQAEKENVLDLDEVFEKFWLENIGTFFDSLISAENRQSLATCRFSKRPYNVNLEQSEATAFVPLHEDGSPSVFENFCDNSGALDIVDAFVGPKSWVVNGNTVDGCSTMNMTELVKKICHTSIRSGNRKCVLPQNVLPTKEQLCPTELCGVYLRYNCIGGSSPDSYSCQALPATGKFTSGSCTCPNSAEPCTYFEARNSEKTWTEDLPQRVSVVLASHGMMAPSFDSQVVYTLSDRHDTLCQASPDHFVLCKAVTVPVKTLAVRREPECSRAHFAGKDAALDQDIECQSACVAAVKEPCGSAENPWICVAKILPACMIPNTDQVSCYITSPTTGLYDADAQTCGCRDSTPCDVASVLATKHAWLPDFQTYSGTPGVIVAANKQALWTKNPERFYYEAGMHKSGGCGKNPWIRGVFCESKGKAPVHSEGGKGKAPVHSEGGGMPLCNTAVSKRPQQTDAECRVRCHVTLEECSNEYQKLKTYAEQDEYVHSCFARKKSNSFPLSECFFESGTVSHGEGKGDVQSGWTTATSAWQNVAFPTMFDSVPIVIAGLPENESPFLTPLIRDVTETGFHIKLVRKGCDFSVSVRETAVVPWLALTEGIHLPRHSENGIRAVTVEFNSPKPISVRADFENLAGLQEAVVLVQIQRITPSTADVESVSVVVTALHSWGAEIVLVKERPSRFSSVVVGVVLIGKQSPDLSFGIPPTLNRRRIETIIIDGTSWSEYMSQRDPIAEKVAKHSHIFGTPVLNEESHTVRAMQAIVLQQRPDVNGSNWKLLPWRRICSTKRGYAAARIGDVRSYVGLLVEPVENASAVFSDNPDHPCESVVAHQFAGFMSSECEQQCYQKDSAMQTILTKCVETCTEGYIYDEGDCLESCEASLPKSGRKCLKQCRSSESTRCKKVCEKLLESECRRHSDKWLCLRALAPIAFLAQCRIIQRSGKQDSLQANKENEDDSNAPQCTIVDMSRFGVGRYAGWDAKNQTCKCPQDSHACSSTVVEKQMKNLAALREAVRKFCEEQHSSVVTTPVVTGFQTPENLCEDREKSATLTWKDLPFPPYSDLDLKLGDSTVPSGETLCRNHWTHVFCTIQPPKEIELAPQPSKPRVPDVSIVSEWLEWGACSATCRTDLAVPFRTRKRFVYVVGSRNVRMSEMKPCDELPKCGEICWTSEWSEWGDCVKRFVGNTMESVQARVKYVYDYNDACADEDFVELRECVDDYDFYDTLPADEQSEEDLPRYDSDDLPGIEDAAGLQRMPTRDEAQFDADGGLYAGFTQQSQRAFLAGRIASNLRASSSLSVLDLAPEGGGKPPGDPSKPGASSDVKSEELSSSVSTPTDGKLSIASPAEGTASTAEYPKGSGDLGQGEEAKEKTASPGQPRLPHVARIVRGPRQFARGNELQVAGKSGVPEATDSVKRTMLRQESTACPPWLSWSGCDAPCIFHPHRLPRSYKVAAGGLSPSDACSRTSKHVRDCADLPVCPHVDVNCEEFEAPTYARAEKDVCRESCEEVFRQCSDLLRDGKYVATSVQKCFLRKFREYLPYPFKCPLSPAHRRESVRPQCFLSPTRRLPSGSFLSRTSNASTSPLSNGVLSGGVNEVEQSVLGETGKKTSETLPGDDFTTGGSNGREAGETGFFVETCECYDPEDEPCTAEEAFDSLQTALKEFLKEPLCPPFFGMGGNLVKDGVETSDSGVYFALKGYQRMHCPSAQRTEPDRHGKSKKGRQIPVTFTTFDTAEDLNNFCKNGLPWWDNLALEFVTPKRLPYCAAAREKEWIDSGTMKCKEFCEQAHTFCFKQSSSPEAVESCLLKKLAAPEFQQNCYMPEILTPGKGIIVCKKKQSDCTLGEWEEWSACTDSCYSDKAARLPLRSRTRKHTHPSSISGAICTQVQDESTLEVEECKGLPLCRDEEEMQVLVDKAYDIQIKQEPELSAWTPTRPPANEPQEEIQSVSAMSCYVADMFKIPASLDRGFDRKYNTCRCPGKDSRPCSSVEVLASLSRWASTASLLCNRDPTLTILAQDMQQFHCALKSFRKLGSQPDCNVQEYALVFCTGEEITSAELSAMWFTCLLFGLLAGLVCVLFFLQHSGDAQKVLGLSGSYPRLIRELNQLHAKEAKEVKDAFLGAAAEEDSRNTACESGEKQNDIHHVEGAMEETDGCAARTPGKDGDAVKVAQMREAQQQQGTNGEGRLLSLNLSSSVNDCNAAERAGFATENERASRVKAVRFADECPILDRGETSSFSETVASEKGGVKRFFSHLSRKRTIFKGSGEISESDGVTAHGAASENDTATGIALQREIDAFTKGFKDE